MQTARLCSRQTCKREATVTLTYSYADSTAVIGPLSEHREPHAYDLCDLHAEQLTATGVAGGARAEPSAPL